MRSICIGIIVLTASMAVVGATQAPTHLRRQPDYGYVQTPMDPEQPGNNDLKSIERDNQDLKLPASQDDIGGADQVHSEEEAQSKRIDQNGVRIDREIRSICPSC